MHGLVNTGPKIFVLALLANSFRGLTTLKMFPPPVELDVLRLLDVLTGSPMGPAGPVSPRGPPSPGLPCRPSFPAFPGSPYKFHDIEKFA